MPETPAHPISNRTRLWLYLRMVSATGFLGTALGYYLQFIDQVTMTPFLVVAFTIRGMIIGALIWAFELFFVLGPNGNRLARLSPAARFAIRIAAYLVIGEIAFWIGQAIFQPSDVIDLFDTANGPS